MVLAKDTNVVFLSKLFRSEYPQECTALTDIFDRQNIAYKFLPNTKSIWCKDYMPIQISKDKFVQFKYSPTYIESEKFLTNTSQVYSTLGIEPVLTDIVLDGGNLVYTADKVIITDRVFDENSSFSSKVKIINKVENFLEAEVIIIPQIKSSEKGLAEEHIRFYDDNTLIGNDREVEYPYWSNKMNTILKDYQLNYIDFPFYRITDNTYFHNIIGNYINFLEVDNLIILPQFEDKENKDLEALNEIQKLYPNRAIETIQLNKIAFEGGLVNGVTWAIQV